MVERWIDVLRRGNAAHQRVGFFHRGDDARMGLVAQRGELVPPSNPVAIRN